MITKQNTLQIKGVAILCMIFFIYLDFQIDYLIILTSIIITIKSIKTRYNINQINIQ